MTAAADVCGLVLRQGYFTDRQAFLALADMLRDIFGIDIGLLDRFGGANPTAMPFGYFDGDGRCVANFSAFAMPLMMNGRRVKAVGYQSGAVRPEFRGRGLYRDLMRRAFAWAKTQDFELGILLTDKPSLYEPYGFRSVPQYAFHGPVPDMPPRNTARTLSLDEAADVALVRRLLAVRQPVSAVFAVADQATEFSLNVCFDLDIRLSYLPEQDAVAAWKETDGQFRLLDIVAAKVPPLADIVGALGMDRCEMIVCFPPDRLAWAGAVPQPYFGSCDLMIRPMTSIEYPAKHIMLSPMAEF